MSTVQFFAETYGFDVPDHLDRDVSIPFLGGIQHQGDTTIVPLTEVRHRVTVAGKGEALPAVGVAVVAAVNGSHEHRLFAHQGVCWWQPDVTDTEGLAVGVLTVPDGSLAVQAHEEHGFSGIAPGCYAIGRQREQAEVERIVMD